MPRWTEETRKIQQERIQQQRPWRYSTGPVSSFGKRISSQNARKHRGHCNVTAMAPPATEGDAEKPLQPGDRVIYIGEDPFIRSLLGRKVLLVIRVKPTLACSTEDGSLLVEFMVQELKRVDRDADQQKMISY